MRMSITGRIVSLAAVLAVASPLAMAGDKADSAKKKEQQQVEHGHYLVQVGGCNDCHTPLMMTDHGPVPDMSRALSGHPAGMQVPPPPTAAGPWVWGGDGSMTAFWGPWGQSYSANITSDATGIGKWKPEEFVKTMKTGKHLGTGRDVLPPMPWQTLSRLSDEDLLAIFAYLQSTKPVQNQVPVPSINPPPVAAAH